MRTRTYATDRTCRTLEELAAGDVVSSRLAVMLDVDCRTARNILVTLCDGGWAARRRGARKEMIYSAGPRLRALREVRRDGE